VVALALRASGADEDAAYFAPPTETWPFDVRMQQGRHGISAIDKRITGSIAKRRNSCRRADSYREPSHAHFKYF
jgi:hypothetical protein